MRNQITLNGVWDWYIPGGHRQRMTVPSSYLPVGEAFFERTVSLNIEKGKRYFLVFDGITYEGTVEFNGKSLGIMLPYSTYRYEITDIVKAENNLKVLVKDIIAPYGSFSGWEDYGGINRDVFIDVCESAFIENYQWMNTLHDDYKRAECTLNVNLDNASGCYVNYTLSFNNVKVSEGKAAVTDNACTFKASIANPSLWSPDMPNLYKLEITLNKSGNAVDTQTKMVGIREFCPRGNRFFLNGKETFLKGVCRHEMYGDQGFTVRPEQVEHDFMLIKQMGANFCRLVHYPHNKHTAEIADRVGLLVSQEPGLWGGSDLGSTVVIDKALEIMRRCILRDRNSPSIIFWLIFNECNFTEEYLHKAIANCKDNDPTRLVSGASYMDPNELKEKYNAWGMDFYTQHPYCYDPGGMMNITDILNDKPVVFTEWGGWFMHENPSLTIQFWNMITDLAHKKKLAGCSWWQFQDMYQFQRGIPACVDGVLSDGLVDRYRKRKPMYDSMSHLFDRIDGTVKWDYELAREATLSRDPSAEYTPISLAPVLNNGVQEKEWERVCRDCSRPGLDLVGAIIPEALCDVGGMPADIAQGRPVVLTDKADKIEFAVGKAVDELTFFGHVNFRDGYPLITERGVHVANYRLVYADGSEQVIKLINGEDIVASCMLWHCSRTNPLATKAQRVLRMTIHKDFELYQVNAETIKTDGKKVLAKVIFELTDKSFRPLLYGVTAKKEA